MFYVTLLLLICSFKLPRACQACGKWLITTIDLNVTADDVKAFYDFDINVDKISGNQLSISSQIGDIERDLNENPFIKSVERSCQCEDKAKENKCYLNLPHQWVKYKIGKSHGISNSLNKFSFSLLRNMKKEENTIFSTYSIASALALCLAGAKGNTEKQIKNLLNFLHLTSEEVHLLSQQLINNLNSLNGRVALNVANKIYLNNVNNEFKISFIKTLETFYKSEIESLNFSDSKYSAEAINKWVMDKTEGKIVDLISEDVISDQVKAILVNAIYFKGNWVHKFNPELTSDENFYLNNGIIKSVKMMKLYNKRLNLKVNPNNIAATVCELPYTGHQIAMTVILPNEGININQIENSLSKETISKILNQQNHYPKVNVFIPKFKFEKTIELSDLLIKMGASDMFDSYKANFSGMTDSVNGLYISKVIHKAIINLNEVGTEAAAASASVIVTRSAMFDDELPIDFICNRPFLFIIHERLNNTILFTGKYTN